MQNNIPNELCRDRKGFNFEAEVVKPLDSLKVKFKSNPILSFEEWKKNKGKGADILLSFAEVECKYRSKYYDRPSYIRRDHIPRFSFTEGIDMIVVTNYKWYYGRKSRALLYEYGIKLMDLSELICYILDKLKSLNGSNTEVLLLSYNSAVNMVLHRSGYIVTYIEDYFDG